MRARSEEEISKLSIRVQHLQKLYESQELIISKNKNIFLYFNVQLLSIVYKYYKLRFGYYIMKIKNIFSYSIRTTQVQNTTKFSLL